MSSESDSEHDAENMSDRLAEARTDWAEDRTIMANERTYASWMGAGMGTIAVAIGLKAVFGEFEPTWAAKAVASFFLLIACTLFWSARTRACATFERLHQHRFSARSAKVYTRLSALMIIGTIGIGAILWSL